MTTAGGSMDDLPLAAYTRRRALDAPDPTDPAGDASEAGDAASAEGAAAYVAASVHSATFTSVSGDAAPHVGALAALGEPIDPAPAIDDDHSVPRRPVGLAGAKALAQRNPRLAAGAGFVAVIVVGLLLLGGGEPAPSAAGSLPSAGTPTLAPVVADPGSASLVLTGALQATFTLTGNPGTPVANSAVSAAWTDPLQNVLTIDGPVDRGTRTTGAGLVMTWGLMIEGQLVTFTSKAGECTIGMASTPKGVSGSFSCKKLKSDDGKLTVGATGTYRT